MPIFEVVVQYSVQGWQVDTLEVEALSLEEAEQKALQYMEGVSDEGVVEVEEESYCEDMRPVNPDNPLWKVEYDITAKEKETSHDVL